MRLFLAVLLTALAAAPSPAADQAASPAAGCLYGTVTRDDGTTATGFLRNDAWDAWWDDIFTATRVESPWAGYFDPEELAKERRAAYFADHGLVDRLAYVLGGDDEKAETARLLLCRYGQIASISLDEDEATVTTLDGTAHRVRRRGRDLSGELTVAGPDSLVLDFDDLRGIVFAEAPAGALPPWRRLAGTVTTGDGVLTGYIQWDRSECADLDVLDGKADRRDHDLPMGTIASIAKDRDGSLVTLRDGRALHLTGTNDVNADNRGISVEVAGLGRVTVAWKDFVRLDLAVPGPSGPARGSFGAGAELRGTATGREGGSHAGRLVYDLDEGWTWDVFNGSRGDTEYEIPFAAIAAVAPAADGCRLTLRSGDVLDLDGGIDATDANSGVLVLGEGDPLRIPWRLLERLEFAD